MNKLIIIVSVFLFTSIKLPAQNDCLNKIAQQAVEISKLKEEVKQTKDLLSGLQCGNSIVFPSTPLAPETIEYSRCSISCPHL